MKNSNKLERFNNTVGELEGEVERLRAASGAYQKLQELSQSYRLILDQFETSSGDLKHLAEEHELKHGTVLKAVKQLIDVNAKNQGQTNKAIGDLNVNVDSRVNDLQKANKQFYTHFGQFMQKKLDEHKSAMQRLTEYERSAMQRLAKEHEMKHEAMLNAVKQIIDANAKYQDQTNKSVEELQRSINAKMDILQGANRQFYSDFEQLVRIKLDEHKSEIQRLIEYERSNIKEMFEDKLSQQTDFLLSKQSKISYSVLIFGILGILLSAVILVKLFFFD